MRNPVISLIMPVVWCLTVLSLRGQTATVVSRPQWTDLRTAASRSAVLIELRNYPSDDARYRLYNGSTQYSCWDTTSRSFITATAYSSGPLVPGSPSATSLFWIPFVRGSNNSANATYRDRLGPLYATNFRDAALPVSAPVEEADTLNGSLAGGTEFNLNEKYILLAFSGEANITASHTDFGSAPFAIPFPKGITIDRIEVRRFDNTLVGVCEGSWSGTTAIGTIALGLINSSATDYSGMARVFPVPATDYLYVEGVQQVRRVTLYDAGGRVASLRVTAADSSLTIDVSFLPPGIYFLRIECAYGTRTVRFIKV